MIRLDTEYGKWRWTWTKNPLGDYYTILNDADDVVDYIKLTMTADYNFEIQKLCEIHNTLKEDENKSQNK